MALLRQGPLGTPSGRICATQFAARRSSVVVSAPGQSRSHDSRAALAARATMAKYARTWNSAAMSLYRPAWEAFASNHPRHDRFGAVRFLSGYQLFLTFVPMMDYYGFNYYQPPMWDTSEYISTASIDLRSDGTLEITTTGYYDPDYTREHVRFARWQAPNRRTRRPSWLFLPLQTKTADATDYTAALAATGHCPVPGEVWQFELTYWSPYKLPSSAFLASAVAS